MPRHHTFTIKTIGILSKFFKNSESAMFDPIEDWPLEIEDSRTGLRIDMVEKPAYIEQITEFNGGWKISAKSCIFITHDLTTDKYERKPWQLVDWSDKIEIDGIEIEPRIDELFKVEDHDSWYEPSSEDEDEDED